MTDQASKPCCRRTTTRGHQRLILETPSGQRITLQDGPGAILIEDANGNSVRLEAGGITINAAAQVKVNASTLEFSASQITVNAGITKFNGALQADTVIANQVVNSSGGNVW